MRIVRTLDNGVRVALDPMPGLATAAVGVWIGAGARDEPTDKSGLAHFLEHMAFKGANGRDARTIVEDVESRGASINASTEYERTAYFVRCLADDAAEMLEVALSLVFAPDHPEAEIYREKSVVRQEMLEAANQPDDLVFELSQVASFGSSDLGRPILGKPSTLRSIKRTDLTEFAATSYTPENIVVSVAGAFDTDKILKMSDHWLAKRSARARGGNAANSSRAAITHRSAVETATRMIDQAHIVVARPGVAAADPNRYAIRLFGEIFGGGMSSRLFQEVREARGLAYSIDASCDQYSDVGRVMVYAACAAAKTADVLSITDDAWLNLASEGPTEAELERAKRVLKVQFAMGAESAGVRAASAAHELLTFGRLVELQDVFTLIDRVNCAEVADAARICLSGAPSMGVVGAKSAVAAARVHHRALDERVSKNPSVTTVATPTTTGN